MKTLTLTALLVLLAVPVARADGAEAPRASGEGAAEKRAELSRAEACRARARALCTRVERCHPGASDLTLCAVLAEACSRLEGPVPYSREVLARCVRGLSTLACEQEVDPSNPASLDAASRVPACRPVIAAERAASGNQTQLRPGSLPAVDIDIGGALQ